MPNCSYVTVTIVAVIIMGLLFLSELYSYLTPKISEDLFVDTTRGSKLKINLDIVFPKIPCNCEFVTHILLVRESGFFFRYQ